MLQLDATQATVLEEILESQRKELRLESARADSRDFRDELHAREDVLDTILQQISAANTASRMPTGPNRASQERL